MTSRTADQIRLVMAMAAVILMATLMGVAPTLWGALQDSNTIEVSARR